MILPSPPISSRLTFLSSPAHPATRQLGLEPLLLHKCSALVFQKVARTPATVIPVGLSWIVLPKRSSVWYRGVSVAPTPMRLVSMQALERWPSIAGSLRTCKRLRLSRKKLGKRHSVRKWIAKPHVLRRRNVMAFPPDPRHLVSISNREGSVGCSIVVHSTHTFHLNH
jgi:hypothetical protein